MRRSRHRDPDAPVQARQLLLQLAFFIFGHRHRGFEPGRNQQGLSLGKVSLFAGSHSSHWVWIGVWISNTKAGIAALHNKNLLRICAFWVYEYDGQATIWR
jgi:hypothetical protein